MKVVISDKQLRITEVLREYVGKHLVEPLTRFYDNQAAELRVEFENSRPRRSGEDIVCHLTLHLPEARKLHVEESTQDKRASLDTANEKLIRAVHKELERMRQPPGHHKRPQAP